VSVENPDTGDLGSEFPAHYQRNKLFYTDIKKTFYLYPRKGGFSLQDKEKKSETKRRHYHENPELHKEMNEKWKQENPEKYVECHRNANKKHYDKNHEYHLERKRKYREANLEKVREQNKLNDSRLEVESR
jgi:hypothetical protein